MSDQSDQNLGVGAGQTPPAKAEGATKKAAPRVSQPPPSEATVSATVDADLKAKIKERADWEDRTETVIVRRALQAYMRDWEPTEDNR